jgi:hypothetical protein
MMMLAFITLSLVSCDKEDDVKKPTFKEELTGTWDITSYKVQGSEYIGVLVNTAILRFFPLHWSGRTIRRRSYILARRTRNPSRELLSR